MDRPCRVCKQLFPDSHYGTFVKDGRRYVDSRCKRCEALRHRPYNSTLKGKFATAKYCAKTRKLNWSLSFEDYYSLISQPCHYCGDHLPETGFGIDRRDSNGDYVLSNVVACCVECNLAKGSLFSYEEFKTVLGPAIASIKLARKSQDAPFVRGQGWGRPKKY